MSSQRANYGIDAPTVVRNMVLAGVSGTLGGVALMAIHERWARSFASAALSIGIWFSISALGMLLGSLVGKFRARDWVVNALALDGSEQVLDVGCGHGLMLIGVAKKLTTGRATGIDIWSSGDQAANTAEATRRNAELEGVDDRVDVRDGDARAIPFPDATFDVIVSSLALHNIENRAEREKALAEIVRVLKPNARIGMIDIFKAREYLDYFTQRGFKVVAKETTLMFMLITRMFVVARSST
jgi:ubiquinone/menaquinone biosynthesis C-methylase UbiE